MGAHGLGMGVYDALMVDHTLHGEGIEENKAQRPYTSTSKSSLKINMLGAGKRRVNMEKLIARKNGKKSVSFMDDCFDTFICVCRNGFQRTCMPVDLDTMEMLVDVCQGALSYLRAIESKKD
jgi:hypothetical protein